MSSAQQKQQNQENHNILESIDQTIDIANRLVENSQKPSTGSGMDVDVDQRSQTDFEPLLYGNNGPTPDLGLDPKLKSKFQGETTTAFNQNTQKVEYNQIANETLGTSHMNMLKSGLQGQMNKTKRFFLDFLVAEDYFKDEAFDNEVNEKADLKIVSDKSWYVEGNLLFTIEPRDWSELDKYQDPAQVKESLDLFMDQASNNIENNLAVTCKLQLSLAEYNENIKSNFVLKIYSITDFTLLLTYNLPISHLRKDFMLQVFDSKFMAIICSDFVYLVEYPDLLRFTYEDISWYYLICRLIKIKPEVIAQHGDIMNMSLQEGYTIFFANSYIPDTYQHYDIEIRRYTEDNIDAQKVFIDAYNTVILKCAYRKLYTIDVKSGKIELRPNWVYEGTSNYKIKKCIQYEDDRQYLQQIVGYNQFNEVLVFKSEQMGGLEIDLTYSDYQQNQDENVLMSPQRNFFTLLLNIDDVDNQIMYQKCEVAYCILGIVHNGNYQLVTLNKSSSNVEESGLFLKNREKFYFKHDSLIKHGDDWNLEPLDSKSLSYHKLHRVANTKFQDKVVGLEFKHQWMKKRIYREAKCDQLQFEIENKTILKINGNYLWKVIYVSNMNQFQFQKCKLSYNKQCDFVKIEVEDYLALDTAFFEGMEPVRFVFSNDNQYFVVTDFGLKGMIFDLKRSKLIKSEDLKDIKQVVHFYETQLVIVQIEKKQAILTRFIIEGDKITKNESYCLSDHLKQIDYESGTLKKFLEDTDETLKREINKDSQRNSYIIDKARNIHMIRLQTSVSQLTKTIFMIFNLSTFEFMGSIGVDIQIYQVDSFLVCTDFNGNVIKNTLLNLVLKNFKVINPLKFHVNIDVRKKQYQLIDMDNQIFQETTYSLSSILLQQFQCQNSTKDKNDIDLSTYLHTLTEQQLLQHFQGLSKSFLFQNFDRSDLIFEENQKALMSINPSSCPQICLPHVVKSKVNIPPSKDVEIVEVKQKTPLKTQILNIMDIAVQQDQYRKITIILDMMLKLNNNLIYNSAIDKHICYLLDKGINLREYFNSDLPFPKIQNLAYPKYSKDDSEVFQSQLNIKTDTLHLIWNNYIKYLGQYVTEINDKPMIQVEQYLINIPETLTNKNFIKSLVQAEKLDYYETEFIQTVLNFKWDKYCYKFYLQQFVLYLVFITAYIIDIYFFTVKGSVNNESNSDSQGGESSEGVQGRDNWDDRSLTQQLILKLVCISYFILQEVYEFRMIKRIGLKEYFSDSWNIIDQALVVLYIVIVIIDTQSKIYEGVVVMQSVMLLILFVKLCELLRVFQGFSFQVTMLKAVFYDIRYFISLYSFVVIVYGLIFTLLKIKTSDENVEYTGIDYFGYFIMSFRASMGDFQIDNLYQLNDSHIIFAWIIWISGVLLMNIILLNFIIAVISESFAKVLEKMDAESFRIKAQLIKERESYFTEAEFLNEEYFPKLIIYRRPVQEQAQENQELQGFVKDIKKVIYKTHKKTLINNENILKVVQGQEQQIKNLENLMIEMKSQLEIIAAKS
eukprot:403363632